MKIGTKETEVAVKRKVEIGVEIEVGRNEGIGAEIGVEIGIEDEIEVGIEAAGWIEGVGLGMVHVKGTGLETGTGGIDITGAEEMTDEMVIGLVELGLKVAGVVIKRIGVRMRRRRETRRKRRKCFQENPNQVKNIKSTASIFRFKNESF